jgi:hypothetical protein
MFMYVCMICMYACRYECSCVCMYVYMYVCAYTQTHTGRIRMYTHDSRFKSFPMASGQTNARAQAHTPLSRTNCMCLGENCVRICVRIYAHVCMWMYVHECVRMYMHVFICMYAHVCACMYVCIPTVHV